MARPTSVTEFGFNDIFAMDELALIPYDVVKGSILGMLKRPHSERTVNAKVNVGAPLLQSLISIGYWIQVQHMKGREIPPGKCTEDEIQRTTVCLQAGRPDVLGEVEGYAAHLQGCNLWIR